MGPCSLWWALLRAIRGVEDLPGNGCFVDTVGENQPLFSGVNRQPSIGESRILSVARFSGALLELFYACHLMALIYLMQPPTAGLTECPEPLHNIVGLTVLHHIISFPLGLIRVSLKRFRTDANVSSDPTGAGSTCQQVALIIKLILLIVIMALWGVMVTSSPGLDPDNGQLSITCWSSPLAICAAAFPIAILAAAVIHSSLWAFAPCCEPKNSNDETDEQQQPSSVSHITLPPSGHTFDTFIPAFHG
jgi:hypothetical protein